AEDLVLAAQEGAPLRFPDAADPSPDPARHVALHSLTTARVMARLVRHDPELRGQPLEPVLAALVHDAGMLGVPAEILARPGALDDEARRLVESHARAGAERAARLLPGGGWLVEAAPPHPERLRGTPHPP